MDEDLTKNLKSVCEAGDGEKVGKERKVGEGNALYTQTVGGGGQQAILVVKDKERCGLR